MTDEYSKRWDKLLQLIGISKTEFIRQTSIDKAAFYRWKREGIFPTTDSMEKISNYFSAQQGCYFSWDWLFYGIGEPFLKIEPGPDDGGGVQQEFAESADLSPVKVRETPAGVIVGVNANTLTSSSESERWEMLAKELVSMKEEISSLKGKVVKMENMPREEEDSELGRISLTPVFKLQVRRAS